MSLSPTVPIPTTSRKATDQRSMQNGIQGPEIDKLLHVNAMMVAIGMAIAFCLLWYLTVFILYQLA
jgi:hypothetical protein